MPTFLFGRCPECDADYRLPADAAGRRARCRTCKQVFVVPSAAETDSLSDTDSADAPDADDTAAAPSPGVEADGIDGNEADDDTADADELRLAPLDDDPDERFPGGQTIRHTAESRRGRSPVSGDSENIERISDHIAAHIGPVDSVFHEIVSEYVHIDVHFVRPGPDRPFNTLITSGMSDRPMNAPAGAEDRRFAELLVTLPPDWTLEHAAFKDERHYWPIRWLKTIARLPHQYETWVSLFHTIPNGDPPEPFAPNTRFCSMLLAPALSLPEEFAHLEVDADQRIDFWALWPLYREEVDFKLKRGAEKLMARFEGAGVTDVVELSRKNVCAKRFGLF